MSTFIFIILVLSACVHAEKVLIYDEEKGIIFVEKEDAVAPKSKKKEITKKEGKESIQPRMKKTLSKARGPEDIHIHRKKDPPDLYLKSGLEYYKNKDYKNALKNFKYASDRDIKPEYLLWIGKTYRQLDKQVQMFTIMERIRKDYPESDVADDALFEMAFYYQKNDNYQKAIEKYAQLAEQYPFGLSFSNGEEFLEVSRKQQRMMRGEMISTLKLLRIKGKTLFDAYKEFQKKHGLKITGEGNPETVKAIKVKYNEMLREDEDIAASTERLKESVRWAFILGILLLVNIIVIIAARVKVAQNRNQLSLLKDMLSDLH